MVIIALDTSRVDNICGGLDNKIYDVGHIHDFTLAGGCVCNP